MTHETAVQQASRERAGVPPSAPRHWGLAEDLEKAYLVAFGTSKPSLRQRLQALVRNFEIHCVVVYRFGQLSVSLLERSRMLGAVPFAIYLFLDLIVRLVFHVQIPFKCRIGPGLHLGHPFTIILGPTTIGSNFSVTHNVTVGMGLSESRRGIPVLGDDVWIGPGATLTGPITIGSGVAIAPGAVVSKDIPARSLVAGNPGRVVNAEYDNRPLFAAVIGRGGGD